MIRLFGKDIFPATTSHDHQVAGSSNSPNSVLDHHPPHHRRQENPAPSSTSSSSSSSASSSSGGKRKRKSSSSSELPNEGKKKQVREKNAQVPTVELSSEFQEMIGNRPVFFVYRKKLTPTDVDYNKQNDDDDERNKAFVVGGVIVDEIGAIDSSRREYKLRLSKWRKDKKTSVFNGQWRQIFADNGAKAGDWVDIWCFDRLEDQPKYCLAVNFITT